MLALLVALATVTKYGDWGGVNRHLLCQILEAGSGKSERHRQVLVRAVFLACRMSTTSCVLVCLRWREGETDREREPEKEHSILSFFPYKGTNPITGLHSRDLI